MLGAEIRVRLLCQQGLGWHPMITVHYEQLINHLRRMVLDQLGDVLERFDTWYPHLLGADAFQVEDVDDLADMSASLYNDGGVIMIQNFKKAEPTFLAASSQHHRRYSNQ